jgi:hypothetical protein
VTWRKLLRAVLGVLVSETEPDDGRAGGDSPFREIEVVNRPTTKTESLERTLDRSEAVLDGQLADIADTDEKAIRMVRIEAILLGAVASVAQVAPGTVVVNSWTTAGGALVVASIIAGVFTSGSSSPDFGPGPDYVRSNFESGDSNEDVYLELLQGYREAISYNSVVMGDSARYLFVAQCLLVGGIVLGGVGVFAA